MTMATTSRARRSSFPVGVSPRAAARRLLAILAALSLAGCQYFPPVDEVAAALESRALELPRVASAELEGTNIELDARVDGTVTMASGATWQDATAVAVALTEAIDGRSERMRYRIDIELPNGETFTLDLTRR